MPPKQSDETFEDINQLIWKFRAERNWLDTTPRSLAISISLEANELLEHYQWDDKPIGNDKDLESELADIMIYAFEFAQTANIDISKAIREKLEQASRKYPAEHFQGKTAKERTDSWIQAKTSHRKSGL